ncbi:MAG: FAD-binding oxidoreductase [Planctomycetaceae bacterium]|nr:FAD-binding oxidoreductase [Planctomycetaceae bacterium]
MEKPSQAYDTIIIGGGITGAGIAYSLSAAGHTRVLLIERGRPACGATAKAATLISHARSHPDIIPYVRETCKQITTLAAGDPDSLGAYQVGAVHAASTPEGVAGLEKTFETSRACGVSGWEIDPSRIKESLPWLETKAIAQAYFYSEECFVDGYLLTTAYLNAAKSAGIDVVLGCAANDLRPSEGTGYEVHTTEGVFHAANVVVAAGAWSNLLLKSLGAYIPCAPVRSQYWITGHNSTHFPPRQPICILPDARVYTRPENGCLVVGWREPECVWVDPRELPAESFEFRFPQDPDGWTNLEGCVTCMEPYFPAMEDQSISRYVAGCSTYTPDGLFTVGELANYPGVYAAAGCAGMGIAVCGGIGRAITELICLGSSVLATEPFSPNRFNGFDVFSTEFMQACAQARSGKACG